MVERELRTGRPSTGGVEVAVEVDRLIVRRQRRGQTDFGFAGLKPQHVLDLPLFGGEDVGGEADGLLELEFDLLPDRLASTIGDRLA